MPIKGKVFRPISFHQTRKNNKTFEISLFSHEGSKKSSKIRLDFAVNDFVFFHCHFHVRFSKQHWVVKTFFFSVDKISCKCEGNVFQKKRLIVTKKQTSPFSSFKSLLVTRKLHLLRIIFRDDARPFVNTSKFILPKHCFICRTRWQKHFFNSWKNESWLFLIF